MGKIKFRKLLIWSITFLLSVTMMIGAGYYKNSITNEKANFKASIALDQENQNAKPIVFDIQNEGLAKKIVQPGKISITTGHRDGIRNNGKEPIYIKVQTTGFAGDVKINSIDRCFDRKTKSFTSPLLPGEAFKVDVTLNIPRANLNDKYLICSGNILIIDSLSGKQIQEIPVNVINSELEENA